MRRDQHGHTTAAARVRLATTPSTARSAQAETLTIPVPYDTGMFHTNATAGRRFAAATRTISTARNTAGDVLAGGAR